MIFKKPIISTTLGILDTPLVPVPEPEVPVRVLLPVVGGDIHQEYWRIFFKDREGRGGPEKGVAGKRRIKI